MSIYTRLNATATRLVEKFGSELTFTRVTKGTFDPATGSSSGDTTQTYTANAVKDTFSQLERSDSSVEIGDIRLIAETATFGPYAVDDLVAIDGFSYRLVNVDPIKPGPTVVAYELQARK